MQTIFQQFYHSHFQSKVDIIEPSWNSNKINFSLVLSKQTCATALSEMGLVRTSSNPSPPPTIMTVDSDMQIVKNLRECTYLLILTNEMTGLF